MWLFGTMTGLRFSDLTALTPLHIKSIETSQGYRNYVEVIQRKTALMVQVPLNATAERILEMVKLRNPDWDYKFFRVTTNGANLDRLAVAAGLFTSVGEYKHITMNTSRHTFSMLLQNSGARPLYVDTLLGHALNSTDLLRANYTVDSFEESPEVYFRLVDAINFLPDTYEGKTDGFLY
jgi:integrase